jgi:hypothetical protein
VKASRVDVGGAPGVLSTSARNLERQPPSSYRDGPGLLLYLAGVQVAEYSAGQSADGLFLPARYFWRFELALSWR